MLDTGGKCVDQLRAFYSLPENHLRSVASFVSKLVLMLKDCDSIRCVFYDDDNGSGDVISKGLHAITSAQMHSNLTCGKKVFICAFHI